MSWAERLKATIPLAQRADFLAELQALVGALRDGTPWSLTPLLKAHPHLVLGYLTPGAKRDAVAAAYGPLASRA